MVFEHIKRLISMPKHITKHIYRLIISYSLIELASRFMLEIENAIYGAQYSLVYNILLIVVTLLLVLGVNSLFQLYFIAKDLCDGQFK